MNEDASIANKTCKVSVCITSFNHAPFIAQAIDSVLEQKTNFPFDIIIADDFSKDETQNILLRYQEKYPNLVRLILNDINIGATKNTVKILAEASGKYVAMLDGDDYWTDPTKLQKQFDFLEANPDYAISFHGADVFSAGEVKPHFLPVAQFRRPKSVMMDLVLYDSFMPTSTIMFRNYLISHFPPEYYATRGINDWPLNVLLTEHGDIAYLDICMSVYRQASSIHAFTHKPIEKILKNAVLLNRQFDRYFLGKHQAIFHKKISGYYLEMSKDQLRRGELTKSKRYLGCANRYALNLKRTLKMNLYYFPKLTLKNWLQKLKNV